MQEVYIVHNEAPETELLRALSSRKHRVALNILKQEHNYDLTNPWYLHYASMYGYADIVLILLNAGASVNVQLTKIFNFTPLHIACSRGHYEVVELLLRVSGIRLDLQVRSGQTPWSWAMGDLFANQGGTESKIKIVISMLKTMGKEPERYKDAIKSCWLEQLLRHEKNFLYLDIVIEAVALFPHLDDVKFGSTETTLAQEAYRLKYLYVTKELGRSGGNVFTNLSCREQSGIMFLTGRKKQPPMATSDVQGQQPVAPTRMMSAASSSS